MDTVSRQAAIDAIIGDGPPELNYDFYYAEKIKELPSAQPKTDWNEMIVICDCCGHAIRVKRVVKNDE